MHTYICECRHADMHADKRCIHKIKIIFKKCSKKRGPEGTDSDIDSKKHGRKRCRQSFPRALKHTQRSLYGNMEEQHKIG